MCAEPSTAYDDDETIAARDALLQEVALYADSHDLGDAPLIDQLRAFFRAAKAQAEHSAGR